MASAVTVGYCPECALLSLMLFASAPSPVRSQETGGDEHQQPPTHQTDTIQHQQVESQAAPKRPPGTFDESDKPLLFYEQRLVEAIDQLRHQEEVEEEQRHADQKSWNSPAVFLQLGLLLVGFAYTLFAWCQWKAIHRQADISAKALRLDQRPWVVLTDNHEMNVFFEANMPEPGNRFPVRIELKNIGRTPAVRLTAELVSCIVSADQLAELPDSLDAPGSQPMGFLTRPFAIGPGIAHQLIATVAPLGNADYTSVFEPPTPALFTVCGVLKYGDPLTNSSQPYETKFCLVWLPLDGRFYLSGPHNDCK